MLNNICWMVEKQVNTHIEKKKKNEWFKWMNGEKNILDQKKKKKYDHPPNKVS